MRLNLRERECVCEFSDIIFGDYRLAQIIYVSKIRVLINTRRYRENKKNSHSKRI